MINIEKSIVIDRPVEAVFAYVTDGSKAPNWRPQVSLIVDMDLSVEIPSCLPLQGEAGGDHALSIHP